MNIFAIFIGVWIYCDDAFSLSQWRFTYRRRTFFLFWHNTFRCVCVMCMCMLVSIASWTDSTQPMFSIQFLSFIFFRIWFTSCGAMVAAVTAMTNRCLCVFQFQKQFNVHCYGKNNCNRLITVASRAHCQMRGEEARRRYCFQLFFSILPTGIRISKISAQYFCLRQTRSFSVEVVCILYLLCGQSFNLPLPAVLIARDPQEDYVVGPYRRADTEPTILHVQRFCFSNLDNNASINMTKVMARINGRDATGWGYNLAEATSDAISDAEKPNN